MLLVFDCNYVCWVCAHALSMGMTYRGGRTEIVYGFVKQLVSLLENFEPSQIAFCWDTRHGKRQQLYPQYKANRRLEATPEEKEANAIIFDQFEEIKKFALSSLGFRNIFEVAGYEADDLIAQIVKQHSHQYKIIVISADKDLFQLLDHCSLYNISKKQTTTLKSFKSEFGILSKDWVKVKALAGCDTDNIAGIDGVGEKTAAKYLRGEMTKGKIFARIEQEKESMMAVNMPLVELPFQGTPNPKLIKNELSIPKYEYTCSLYGMESLLRLQQISRWQKIITRLF